MVALCRCAERKYKRQATQDTKSDVPDDRQKGHTRDIISITQSQLNSNQMQFEPNEHAAYENYLE